MGDLINFPKPAVKLNHEEYEKFLKYKQAMLDAKTIVESKYYFKLAMALIDEAKKRNNLHN